MLFLLKNFQVLFRKRIEKRIDDRIEIKIISEAWTGHLASYPGAPSMKTLENCGQLRKVFPLENFAIFVLKKN